MINETFGKAILAAMFGQNRLAITTFKYTSSGSTTTPTAEYSTPTFVDGGLGTACYIGLMTDDKTEMTDLQYERKLIGRNSQATGKTKDVNEILADQDAKLWLMTAPTYDKDTKVSSIKNEKMIIFNEIDPDRADSVTVTHFGLFPAVTGGSPVYVGKLKEPIVCNAGNVPLFREGKLKVTIGGENGDTEDEASLNAE